MTIGRIRAALLADAEVGAGNVLPKLVEHGAPLDGPGIAFDVEVDGVAAGRELTLGLLLERVKARAGWLSARGIRPRDPVAVFGTSSADYVLNYLGLVWLGAIPALVNRNLPGEVAAEYIRRLGAVGLLTDTAHRQALAGHDFGVPVIGELAEVGGGDPAAAPAPYRHHPDDPIAIVHSSGTTRMPAAAVHSHRSLYAGTRRARLTNPVGQGLDRVLCAMPTSHAAAITSVNTALGDRAPLLVVSTQDDGAAILDAIERWRPRGVYGFAVTWAELARYDLDRYDLGSVALWLNTGDCAHEAHIRRLVACGSRDTVTRAGRARVQGSTFLDCLGSTEMGFAAFQIFHRSDTNRYGRCIGRPTRFVEVALLDLATGTEVPVGQVGHFGLRSPTLAPGYWNDSVNTYRTRLDGWYLTGDLLYRDAEGYYYHVDRAVDAIDLGGGEWLYTAATEERILATCPDVHDCTVVAVRTGDRVVTDVLLSLRESADRTVDRTDAVRAALGRAAATLRRVVAAGDDELVLGPTGKVRKFLLRQRYAAEVAAG